MLRSEADIKRYIDTAVEVDPDRPVLVDKYLDRADELDVDALCDREGNVVICGIMQHIEQAGVHSGDYLLVASVAMPVLQWRWHHWLEAFCLLRCRSLLRTVLTFWLSRYWQQKSAAGSICWSGADRGPAARSKSTCASFNQSSEPCNHISSSQ